MKKFIADPSFWELFPDAAIGVLTVKDVSEGAQLAPKQAAEVTELLKNANAAALAHLDEGVALSGPAVRRLLEAGDGDAALLYIAVVQNRGAMDGEKVRARLKGDGARFPAGQRVRHAVFGPGVVLGADAGRSAYTVQFDGMETPRSISFRVKLERE